MDGNIFIRKRVGKMGNIKSEKNVQQTAIKGFVSMELSRGSKFRQNQLKAKL